MRLFHTLIHLTLRQLYYQVKYKIGGVFKSVNNYRAWDNREIQHVEFKAYTYYHADKIDFKKGAFTYLNLTHTFKSQSVDWNFMSYGKLWNYHLQYLDCINDDTLSLNDRLAHLESFSECLLSGELRAEPYVVSLRLWNMLIFAGKHTTISESVELAIKRQYAYLEKHVEYHIDGNHLLENLICLSAGEYLSSKSIKGENQKNDFDKNLKWFQRLSKELMKQISPSGAHYELSPSYHFIILQRLKLLQELYTNFEQLNQTIIAMQQWQDEFQWPDGTWANFGDSYNVKLKSIKDNSEPAPTPSTQHPVPDNNSPYQKYATPFYSIIIKSAPPAPAHQPGHSHADIGSFCLWANGKELITDMGVSTYENNEQRLWERGTASHNTVCIDKKNQSDVWSSFRVGKRASCKTTWMTNTKFNLEIRYAGLIHTRKFDFDDQTISISDDIKGFHQSATFRLNITDLKSVKLESNNSIQQKKEKLALGFNRFTDADIITIQFSNSNQTRIKIISN